MPIQLAQCRFPGQAISNAKILIYFSNKIYGINFVKKHSETVTVSNYQNADCSLRKNSVASLIIIFGTLSHMFQLMPLPLTVSCFSKIQIGFTFLVPAHLGSPGKMAVKRVCVCGVCVPGGRGSTDPICPYVRTPMNQAIRDENYDGSKTAELSQLKRGERRRGRGQGGG